MAAARRLLGMAALGRLLGAGALLAGLGAACGAAAKDLVPLYAACHGRMSRN